ncbi:RIP metalloprotease RseP [Miniphocaeibacter massiliensis]|uniref:RIP metalloprotease RseP n=1 Tax=Miniphocaeibacter massiliensis TaxID=2041841 RepID=UPI000C07E1F5|nr:RIP metalloprotease RseP [Miniphocaeibacter massiliensis]
MVITTIASVVVFLMLIFIHELGHFLVAIKSGIKVNEFSIGMGPKIYQTTKKDIKYSLRIFPIGGYVAIEGEDENSNDPKAFNNAKPIKRLAVIVAGVIMNFILGFLIMFFISSVGQPGIVGFSENSVAEKSGIKVEDKILEINGNQIKYTSDISKYISSSKEKEVDILIKRNDEELSYKIIPEKNEKGEYLIGIEVGSIFSLENFSITRGFVKGFENFKYASTILFKSFIQLFTGKIPLSELSGPVMVVKTIGTFAQQGILQLLNFVALMSINLGIFNILPFPALDGGRAVLIIIEMITGKKLPEEKEGMLNYVGFIFLIGLMIVVFFKDIISLL